MRAADVAKRRVPDYPSGRPGRERDPLLHLAMELALQWTWPKDGDARARAKAIANGDIRRKIEEASAAVDAAISEGALPVLAPDCFAAATARELWPTPRGRGKGPGRATSFFRLAQPTKARLRGRKRTSDRDRIVRMIETILSSEPGSWAALYGGKSERNTRVQLNAALEHARIEIDARERNGLLAAGEADRLRERVGRWQKGGRRGRPRLPNPAGC